MCGKKRRKRRRRCGLISSSQEEAVGIKIINQRKAAFYRNDNWDDAEKQRHGGARSAVHAFNLLRTLTEQF